MTNPERIAKLGTITISFGMLPLLFAAVAQDNVMRILALGAALLAVALGVGLRMHQLWARIVAGILYALCAAIVVVQYAQTVPTLSFLLAESPRRIVSIANATAASILFAWLCARATMILANRAQRFGATRRMVGLTIVVVTVHHLFSPQLGGITLSMSPNGIALYGFRGWFVWHATAAVIGALLVVGGSRTGARAALGLCFLLVVLVPLSLLVSNIQDLSFNEESFVIIAMTAMPLLFVYPCKWLHDEALAEVQSFAQ